ncbi:MAG: DUF3857 domain-containing protein [Acidobacteriota bacterium]|nr:DUF3857 domain-containing protein [Acidobacteriota bacterium]
MRAATAVTRADHPEVIILLSEHQYRIRADGRVEAIIRQVYRVNQQEAVEEWSAMEQQYQPWYQDKPELRARVITGDGKVRWLDVNTIADSPMREFESNIFSDARVLRAPLPAVAAGALVEYEIKVRDRIPMLNAGTTHRILVNRATAMERFHAVIQAEPGVVLRMAARLIPESAMKRETGKEGARIEVELGPSDPPKEYEGNLPFDESSFPYLSFSTGSSWQSVATAYAAIVNAKIGSGEGGLRLEAIDRQGSPREIATQLTAKLHKWIRYTGVEFGEAAIVPVRPADAVSRGYGDCKDKATVLVAMLREAGLKADVALLLSGFGPDVDAGTPGLGQFDHAIVYVDAKPPLWIDATAAEVRVGMLPPGDQGRLALIANAGTTALVKTPESKAEENWQRNKIEMKMSELGAGEVKAVLEGSGGWYETNARTTYGGDGKRAKQALEALVKTVFAAKSLGAYRVMTKDDFSGPYRIEATANQAAVATTGTEDAGAALLPSAVLESLPYGLAESYSEKGDEPAKPRQHDFVFAFPFQSEYRYRIVPPVGFKLSSKPEPAELKLGPAALSLKYTFNTDGTMEAVYRFDSAKRRWTAEEVEAFRAAYRKLNRRQPEVLVFLPETSELVATGQMGKAVALLRDHVKQDSGNAMAHARFARILIGAGMGGVALDEAREAVRLDPKAAAAWATLGWTYQHDTFGRPMKGNWNYAEAEKCLRKVVELEPTDYTGKMNLAILLEHDGRGWRYAKDSRVEESITIYRELIEKNKIAQPHQNLAITLLRTGQLDAAKEEAKKCVEPFQAQILPLIQALQDGAARGMASATTGQGDARQRGIALGSISYTLSMMRQYALAQSFMSAAARVGNMPSLTTQAELLGKVKHWEDTILPENDPAWPVQHLLVEGMRGTSIEETMGTLLAATYRSDSWQRAAPAMANAVAGIKKDLAGMGMEDEALLDYVSSLTAFEKAGDEKHGYRIKSTMPGWGQFPAMYVVNERGKQRIIGVFPDGLDAVGDLVLTLLEKKDLAGAQWWLDRVVSDAEARSDGTGLPPVKSIWSGTTAALRAPAAIRLAAASLIGAGRADAASIQLLRTTRLNVATTLERDQLDKALSETLARARKWDDLTVVAKRLIQTKLFSEEGFRYLLKATVGSGNWKELEAEAQRRATANPTNTFATSMVVLTKAHLGDDAGAEVWTKKLLAPEGGTNEQVLAAWISVDAGKPNGDVLEKLKKAGYQNDALSFAMAVLQAALHQPDEAMQNLLRAVDKQDYFHLSAKAWLAYGQICEEYGFKEEAGAARIRAKEAPDDEEDGPGLGGRIR